MKKIMVGARLLLMLACAGLIVPGLSSSSGLVSDQPRILRADETQYVHLGDSIEVEERTLVNGEQSQVVQGQIITPSGASYSGDTFLVSEIGTYRVVYSAYFGMVKVQETVNYFCQRRSVDFFSSNSSASVSFGSYRYNYGSRSTQGVICDFALGGKVTFNKEIAVSALNLDTPLLDFIVDPTTQGSKDFTAITIRISSIADENDYVDILMGDAGASDYDGVESYCRAGYAGSFLAGREINGNWHTNESGTGTAGSFRAYPLYLPDLSMKFYFDYANKALYARPASFSKDRLAFINDLDSKDMYQTNPWAGYQSDKVKISLIPSGFKNSRGRILIKSIAGIDLTSEEMSDEAAPSIKIDYLSQNPSDLPKAKVGSAYKIFPASVSDNYDDGVPLKVAVTYHDPVSHENLDVGVDGDSFLTSKSGTYSITYNATDFSNNPADEIKLKVYTSDTLTAPSLSYDKSSQSVLLYAKATIPAISDIAITGGSGSISVSRSLFAPDGQEISVEGNSFTPSSLGEYKAVYTAVDYLGQSSSFTYTITAEALDKPLFIEEAVLPPALIKGFSYSLNCPKAIETVGGQIYELTPQLQVNGAAVTSSFVASGDSMAIAFIASGESGTTSQEYALKVVDGNNTIDQAAYFQGDLSVAEEQDDIYLTSDKEGTTTFINPLDSNAFSLSLSADADHNNFSSFTIRLADADDPSLSLSFKVTIKGISSASLTYPGGSSDFLLSEGEMRLAYSNQDQSLQDLSKKTLAYISQDDNGSDFSGFGLHGVYLSLSFNGVTGSSGLYLRKISNQSLGNKGGSEPEKGKPVINLSPALQGEQFYGADFAYPQAVCFDVFSQIAEKNLKVVSPSNSTLLNGDPSTLGTFAISEYGSYRLIYTASDSLGNSVTLRKTVFVNDDVAPTLTVNPLKKSAYSLGEAVEVPTYEAADNLGYVYVDVLLILPDNQIRLLSHDDNGDVTYYLNDELLYSSSFRIDDASFRTEQLGKYTLRYLAYDEQYNTTSVELSFQVGED